MSKETCSKCGGDRRKWTQGCEGCRLRWVSRLNRKAITKEEFQAVKPPRKPYPAHLRPKPRPKHPEELKGFLEARRKRIEAGKRIYLKFSKSAREKALLSAFTQKKDVVRGTNGEPANAMMSLSCKHCVWEKTIFPSYHGSMAKARKEIQNLQQEAKEHWENTHAQEWALEEFTAKAEKAAHKKEPVEA
jgi:hypothetical protein